MFLLLGATVQAQHSTNGIQFFSGTWADVLKESARTHKTIFVDAYASWCGPCKWMAANVFTNNSVAAYYNKTFINYQIDMEKGEGPGLSKSWNITAYPSFMFINSENVIQHKVVGSMDTTKFIAVGTAALDTKNNLHANQLKFYAGDRSAELLKMYASQLSDAYDDSAAIVANIYFNTLNKQQWQTPENLELLNKFLPEVSTPVYQYFYVNRNDLIATLGEGKFLPFLANAAVQTMQNGYHQNDEVKIMDGFTCLKNLEMEDELIAGANIELNFYKKNKNWDEYKKLAVQFASTYFAKDANSLNNLAWSYFETFSYSNIDLIQAMKWANFSVAIEDKYYNNDTYANLLFALGKYSEAKTVAEHAIALANAYNEDGSATEELLQKINDKLK